MPGDGATSAADAPRWPRRPRRPGPRLGGRLVLGLRGGPRARCAARSRSLAWVAIQSSVTPRTRPRASSPSGSCCSVATGWARPWWVAVGSAAVASVSSGMSRTSHRADLVLGHDVPAGRVEDELGGVPAGRLGDQGPPAVLAAPRVPVQGLGADVLLAQVLGDHVAQESRGRIPVAEPERRPLGTLGDMGPLGEDRAREDHHALDVRACSRREVLGRLAGADAGLDVSWSKGAVHLHLQPGRGITVR